MTTRATTRSGWPHWCARRRSAPRSCWMRPARGPAEVNDRINAVVVDVDPPRSGSETGPFAGVPFLLKDLRPRPRGLPDQRRLPVAGHDTGRSERHRRRAVAGRRAGRVRQDQHAGVRGQGRHRVLPVRTGPQPVEHRPHTGRLLGRRGGCGGRRHRAVRGGQRRRRFDPHPGLVLRPVRTEALPWAGAVRTRCSRRGWAGTATHGVISRSVRDTAAMLDVLVGGTPDGPYLPRPRSATPYADEVGQRPGPRSASGSAPRAPSTPRRTPRPSRRRPRRPSCSSRPGHPRRAPRRAPFDDEALAKDFLTTWFVYAADAVAQAKAVQRLRRTAASSRTPWSWRRWAGPPTRRPGPRDREPAGARAPARGVPPVRRPAAHPVHRARRHRGSAQLDLPARHAEGSEGRWSRCADAGLLRFTPIVNQLINENLGWVPYTQLANLTGRPAMSVPLHWTADGLPIGAQLVGRLGAEGRCCALAAQLEQAQPWADRRPAALRLVPGAGRGVSSASR